jgi:hypothetical protein
MSDNQELLEEIRQIRIELEEIKSYMINEERNSSFLTEIRNLLKVIILRLG